MPKIFQIIARMPIGSNPGYALKNFSRKEQYKETPEDEYEVIISRAFNEWVGKIETILAPLLAIGLKCKAPTMDDYEYKAEFVCSGEQLIEILATGIQVDIKSSSDLGPMEDSFHKFKQLIERMERVSEAFRNGQPAHFNEVCHVHMPGQALAMYNETMLVTDACTDVLQGHLDAGWRIIAACPQPDQRRPDYIMGRYNPDRNEYDLKQGAARG